MCGGIDPHNMTLWEWQALTWNWNDRHSKSEEGGDKARPDPELVKATLSHRKGKLLTPPSIPIDPPA